MLYSLPGKEQSSPAIFRIEVIQHLHQFFTPGVRHVVVKQVELSQTLTEEATKNNSRFLILVAVAPNRIKATRSRADDGPTVLCFIEELLP